MTTKKKRELISRAAYAKRRGVAPRTIGKYTQKGIIPVHDNKVDPEEADKALAAMLVQPLGSGRQKGNTGKSATPKDPATSHTPLDTGNSFVTARTREKQIKVELLELELQLKKGEMVLNKDVEFAAFTAARHVRDKMLNIPDRICATLAAETDETVVRNTMIDQIEKELRSISVEKTGEID